MNLRLIVFNVVGSLILGFGMAGSAQATLINGDFETGDFTGWTFFLTEFGGIGTPAVVPFDTNGDSLATNSARFNVGQIGGPCGIGSPCPKQGGGILQNFTTRDGQLMINVDIASNSPGGPNGAGGVYTLLIDNILIDSIDFGDIFGIERSTLSATTSVSAGVHELRIQIERNGGETTFVDEYIDNVRVHGDALSPNPVLTGDSFLQSGGNHNFNEGANHVLVVDKKGTKRAVVGFDFSTLTTRVVSSARLVFTLERPTQDWGAAGGTLDAHRLTEPFTEGNGLVWGQTLGLGDHGIGSGVTWNCATDTDISNRKTDCEQRWRGGSQASESVTDSAVITNEQTGEVSWDVTVDVQAALNEQATTIQWLIRKTQEHRKGQAVFYSKEGAAGLGDMTKAPRLELEFVE